MQYNTCVTYFKTLLYSLVRYKYTNYLSFRILYSTYTSMDFIKHYIGGYNSCLNNEK